MNPDFVQKSYDRTLADGLPGSNADANPTTDMSFIAEASAIPYGVAISKGSGYVGQTVKAKIGTTGASAATAGYAEGTGVINTTISYWTAITDGEFSLLIDGTAFDATGMDFSSITDMDGVATVIQNKIQSYTAGGTAFTSATVVFDSDELSFKITSGTTGATSTVTYLDNVDGGYGTEVLEALGLDSALYVAGKAIVSSATLLGVVMRHTVDAATVTGASTVSVAEGDVGAFRQQGTIKVLCTEAATAGGNVYVVNATGEIVSASGAGRTQLGSSTFAFDCEIGKVGIVKLNGLG